MDTSPTHILVVDDEKTIRDGCSLILTAAEYIVDIAEDGHGGLEKMKDHQYDIALVDLKMPGISGIELIENIKQLDSAVVPIAMTGYASISSAVEAMKMGAYDYLTKPFTPDELMLIVKRAEETVRLRKTRERLLAERERSLKDIASEKGRMKSVLESLADGIIVMDAEGRVALTNPSLRTLLKSDDEDSDLSPELTLKIGEKLQQTAAGLTSQYSKVVEEITLGAKEEVTVSVSYAPVYNGKHEVIGSVAVIRDITKIKELDKEKFNFVRMVTHELKAPVGAIQGYLDLILDGLLDDKPEKQHEILQRSRDRAAALLKLIGDLLSVMKMRSGLVRRNFEPVALDNLAKDIVALLKVDADAKNISLELAAAPDFPPIEADKSNMEELITNLVSNAIKYNRTGGSVTLSLKRHSRQHVAVECRDTGLGIPQEAIPRLFDEFFRVRNQATNQITGTGLGLSIVKEIVEAHGGRINVESELEKGTTFTVYLPEHHKTDESGTG